MGHRNPRRTSIVGSLSAFVGILAISGAAAAPAAEGTGAGDFGQPMYTTETDVTNFSADATTIPYFRSTLTDPTNGATYPYTKEYRITFTTRKGLWIFLLTQLRIRF
jgi:hypothetical protein